MTRLLWDQVGDRLYETGVDKGVLYPVDALGDYETGIPWNGLANVTESPSGAEASPIYADNIKYLNLLSAEEFGCTIEAFTYPDEFAACDGSLEHTAALGLFLNQQTRKKFGLCYRTKLGNDVLGDDYGYKIHLIYGCMAAPSEKAFQTINDSPEPITFSWEVTTTPVEVGGIYKPVASLTIDSTKVDPAKLLLLEDLLYGDATAGLAQLPLPSVVISTLTPA